MSELGTFRPLTDFEKKLFYKREVQDLKKELAEKNFKIGEMQSEIDELKYELENVSRSRIGKMLQSAQKANADKKRKIKELKSDLSRYTQCYGRLS